MNQCKFWNKRLDNRTSARFTLLVSTVLFEGTLSSKYIPMEQDIERARFPICAFPEWDTGPKQLFAK